MRKQKLSRQAPIQLSYNKKSHSINIKTKQEQLFAPYKIEWKTPSNDSAFYGINQSVPLKEPFRNVENNSQSKVFYQNMKNQLLNIKQDVEKLMMKQKPKDKTIYDSGTSRNDSYQNQTSENSNGYVRTVNIKNKCQQKMSKIQSLYENVNTVLAGKICDSSNKFTVGESSFKTNNLKNQNFIESSQNRLSNIENMYRSQKDTHVRVKSKSIADNGISKGIYFIDLTPSKDIEQNEQEQSAQKTHIASSSRPKFELNIDLPSFDRLRLEQKKVDEEKSSLIQKLKLQLHQLEKQLSQKDQKLQKQSSLKMNLNKEVSSLSAQLSESNSKKLQLQKLKDWHINQLNNLHNASLQQDNKIQFLQLQLQKALTFIRQKEQQNFNLIQTVNEQNATILQLGTTCQQLAKQRKTNKQASTDEQKLKEKLKLKQNQLYIYQEQLKEAKLKIKDLKQTLQNFHNQNSSTQNNQKKQSLNDQQELIDQTQQIKWELKEKNKIIDTLKSQNERLAAEIRSIKQINNQTQSKINQLFKQNSELRQRNCELQKDTQKAFQQMLNTQGFQSISEEISRKLSVMVDENYSLKNKISHLESTLEELTLRNSSLSQEVKIYEEKSNLQGDCGRRLKIEDWDNLTDERDLLKSDLEKLQSRFQETKEFYELETMRKQNCIYELKMQINQMLDQESSSENQFHANIRCVKHIKNLDSLLKGFKEMIDENLAIKEQISQIKKSYPV